MRALLREQEGIRVDVITQARIDLEFDEEHLSATDVQSAVERTGVEVITMERL